MAEPTHASLFAGIGGIFRYVFEQLRTVIEGTT